METECIAFATLKRSPSIILLAVRLSGGKSQSDTAERHPQQGGTTGSEHNFISSHVAGFDAHHLLVLVVAEVGHLLRLGDPRIPDHRRFGAGFLDAKSAAQGPILNFD